MSKPGPELVARATAIPALQRVIEVASGHQRVGEVTDALAGVLKIEAKSFERSWFRYRQPGGTIPTVDLLLNLVEAARALNWLPRPSISDAYSDLVGLEGKLDVEAEDAAPNAPSINSLQLEVVGLLEFLDAEFYKRRRAAYEPTVKQFAKEIFERLSALDLHARTTAAAAKRAGRSSGSGKEVDVSKQPATARSQSTSTFASSLPIVMRAVSQAFVDLIERDYPDWQSRPSGLTPEALGYVDAMAGEPFRTLAEVAEREQKEWEALLAREELSPEVSDDEGRLGSKLKKTSLTRPEIPRKS